MKMKGFVKVTKKDANTGEELYESDWIENIIYDANFTSAISAMSLSVQDVAGSTALTAPTFNDPYQAYYQASGSSMFTHYLYANDHYEAAPSSTVRSQPGKFWQFQKIQGTPFALVEGNGQTTTPTLKFTQQLLPPVSGTRDIHTIGWTQSRPTYQVNTSASIRNRPKPRTAASFTPAITQSTTEILVVVYKIEYTFPTSSTTLSYDQMSALTWLMAGVPNPTPQQSLDYYNGSSRVNMDNSSSYRDDTLYSPFKVPLASRRPNATYVAGKPNTGGYASLSYWSQLENNASFSGHGWDGIVYLNSAEVKTTDTNVGDFISSISVRGGGMFDAAWVTRMIGSNTNKTQQYYGKVSGSTVPFFSAGEIPSTDATLTLDTATYSTTLFPELWSIDLGGVTGGVGTAEYSLRKRYVTGWVNNTLVPRVQVLHHIQEANVQTVKTYSDWGDHTGDLATSGRVIRKGDASGMDNYGRWVVPGNPLKLYDMIEDNVHFYNLETGENSAVNILQYPAFTATNIGGHAYDEISDTLWLACQDTGLWKIASPYSASPTVSNLDLSSISDVAATVANNAYVVCLGLAVGGTHRTAWAIMNGALAKSTDNGATWVGYDSTSVAGVTFTQATIEGKWAAAMCIVADKNTDNKLLVLYETSPNSLLTPLSSNDYGQISGVWWDNTSDTTQLMADSGAIPFYYPGSSGGTSARIGFGHSDTNPPSRSQLDNYTIPWFRRNYVNMIGCTRTQSHWYMAHLNTNQSNYLSGGTNRNAPVLLTHGTQIGPAGAGYTELLSGDTYTENWNSGLVLQWAFPTGLRSSISDSWVYYQQWGNFDQNYSYWLGHTEHVDDDGNDCIIKTGSDSSGTFESPTNVYKFTFTTSRLDNMATNSWTSDPRHQTQYIGKGLLTTSAVEKFNVFSLSDGTIEGVSAASKMAGDVWQRYVWTGSIWRLRTSDADPLTLKSTHGTTDALIGGATISFDDAGSTQSFVSGEAISTHVVDGIIVDSATSTRSYSPTLSMWDNEIVTEVTNGTIASSTPSELLPVTYYDNVDGTGHSAGFNTDVASSAWGSAFVFEDTHSTTAYYSKQGSGPTGGFSDRRMNAGWNHGEYPEFRSRLGWRNTSSSLASAPILHLSTRYNSSEATTGDFNLETSLINPNGYSIAHNTTSAYVYHWGLLDHRNQDDGNDGWKIETAFGLVNAASYTDGASPAQGVLEEAEILYGFKVIPGKLFDSLMTNYSSSAILYMSSQLREDNSYLGSYTYQSANISDMMNEGPQSTPMTIQIIESGSVVFTQPAGDRYYSVISLFDPETNANRPLVNMSLSSVELNATTAPEAILGNRDVINDRYCPFNIERVGTTVKYYLRDKLIYTSLASSSENLMPAVFTSFADAVSITAVNAQTNNLWGHMHGQVFKKPQTDFFVKVGTSGSSNGAFNSNFLYLQTSVREGFSIKIDGVEATVVGLEDNGTLNAGEVSVFPRQGLIRCSSADAGKTVTVSIPCAYRS